MTQSVAEISAQASGVPAQVVCQLQPAWPTQLDEPVKRSHDQEKPLQELEKELHEQPSMLVQE